MAPEEAALTRDIVRWDSALCASACAFLREDASFLGAGAGALTPAETEWLCSAQQPPVAALQVISALLKRSSLSVYERAAVEQQLGAFDVALGALERIRSQTIPLAYTR
jgi:predicted membrane chloride channel (bestrophin family)